MFRVPPTDLCSSYYHMMKSTRPLLRAALPYRSSGGDVTPVGPSDRRRLGLHAARETDTGRNLSTDPHRLTSAAHSPHRAGWLQLAGLAARAARLNAGVASARRS